MKFFLLMTLCIIISSCSSEKLQTINKSNGYVFQDSQAFLLMKVNLDKKTIENCQGYHLQTKAGREYSSDFKSAFFSGRVRVLNENYISYFENNDTRVFAFAIVNDELEKANKECEKTREKYIKDGYKLLY